MMLLFGVLDFYYLDNMTTISVSGPTGLLWVVASCRRSFPRLILQSFLLAIVLNAFSVFQKTGLNCIH